MDLILNKLETLEKEIKSCNDLKRIEELQQEIDLINDYLQDHFGFDYQGE